MTLYGRLARLVLKCVGGKVPEMLGVDGLYVTFTVKKYEASLKVASLQLFVLTQQRHNSLSPKTRMTEEKVHYGALSEG